MDNPEVITPTVSFESVTFSDAAKLVLDPTDIVVFVGPNNAGKSAALRELESHIGPSITQTVIKAVQLRRTGTVEQLRSFLDATSRKKGKDNDLHYQGYGYNLADATLESFWKKRVDLFRALFCRRIATETRITRSNSQPAIAVLKDVPSHPIHMLFLDDRIEARLSAYFQRAFGQELIVFRGGGGQFPLMVGKRPELLPGEDRVAATYLQRLLDQAKQLDNEGDGMRSFASVILDLLAPTTQSVLLLDEPEAYLHPPQARLLGEFIATERPEHSQLFVATHSPDVLHGLLQVAPDQLRIVRLQRDGNINRVKELDKAKAKAIGTDPLMKFSSVLSGVFHERVIVCESDADCMFYNALLDLPDIRGPRQPDVLFLHASGKHRMAALAEAMRALGVSVDIVADIDILNDLSVLQKVVEALGGLWSEIEAEAAPLKKAVEQHKPWLNSAEVAKGVREVLEKAPASGEFPKGLKAEVDSIFRKASPWDAVKDAGAAAIPPGQATMQYNRLNELCRSCGLWIVPVGELENFCKAVGGHGPRWVQHVLETYDLATEPLLSSAREFVEQVWKSKPQPK
jgi:energy-coupling factor transporter ATP-binding protein EcfA2